MDKFNSNRFESEAFLIESAEAPNIKPGGSSSSNILNRYFNALAQDIALLATRTNILASRCVRLENGSVAQSGALSAALQSVSTRVDAASGYSQILADIHSLFYVDPTTTATTNQIFGQATLPILSQTDLLVQLDVYGNKYISSEVQLSWTNIAGLTPASIPIINYQIDPEGIPMITEDQVWLVDTDTTNPVWFKIKAPLQFQGLTPNVLEISPFPALGVDLMGVWYQKAGDSNTGTWYSVDMSYLPRYDSVSGKAKMCGPVRLHLPNDPISQIIIALNSPNTTTGLKRVKLYHNEYATSASLVLLDPYNRFLGDIVLRGKDTSILSQFAILKTSNKVQVTMTTTNSIYTPVITGAIIKVS